MAKAYPPTKIGSKANASREKLKGAPKDLGPKGSAGTRRSSSAPGNYTRTSAIVSSQSAGKDGKMPEAEKKANAARTKRAMKDTNRAAKKATESRVAAKAAAKTAAKKVLTRAAGPVGAALMAKDVYDTIKQESKKSKSGATGGGRSKAAK